MVAALGLRAHSGWAAMVAVSGGSVILRRRIDITGSGPAAKQPYHAAEEMKLPQAQAFLKRSEKAAVEMAAAGVKGAIATLAGQGYRVAGAAVLLGSGKPLPEVAKILAAHPLIHTAEGVFFREVLRRACERCGLAVTGIKEREVLDHCAEALGIVTALNQATLSYLKSRKQFGVPIGTFQALQHRMADMYIAGEQVRSMAIVAAVHADTDDVFVVRL